VNVLKRARGDQKTLFIENLRWLNNWSRPKPSNRRMALESFGSRLGDGLRCRCGSEMRVYEVRIDRRVASSIGGWERALSYDRWVCDACGEYLRRPARLDPLAPRGRRA
jgi:hypothetical protein